MNKRLPTLVMTALMSDLNPFLKEVKKECENISKLQYKQDCIFEYLLDNSFECLRDKKYITVLVENLSPNYISQNKLKIRMIKINDDNFIHYIWGLKSKDMDKWRICIIVEHDLAFYEFSKIIIKTYLKFKETMSDILFIDDMAYVALLNTQDEYLNKFIERQCALNAVEEKYHEKY